MEAAILSQARLKSQVWKIWFQFNIKEQLCLLKSHIARESNIPSS